MSYSLLARTTFVLVATAGLALAQGPVSPPAASRNAPTVEQMNAQMQRMQSLHEQWAAAKTPQERQQLMSAHRQAMQEGMAMMAPMMGSAGMGGRQGMMGAGPGKGGAPGMGGTPGMGGGQGKGGAMAPGGAGPSMEMMERRLDMMQMMMQMMMDQQGVAGTSPGSPAK